MCCSVCVSGIALTGEEREGEGERQKERRREGETEGEGEGERGCPISLSHTWEKQRQEIPFCSSSRVK